MPHQVLTARGCGWDKLSNGKLLAAATKSGFVVFLTVDQNLPFQQNLGDVTIAIVVMRAVTNDVAELSKLVPLVMASLESIKPGEIVRVPPERAPDGPVPPAP